MFILYCQYKRFDEGINRSHLNKQIVERRAGGSSQVCLEDDDNQSAHKYII